MCALFIPEILQAGAVKGLMIGVVCVCVCLGGGGGRDFVNLLI